MFSCFGWSSSAAVAPLGPATAAASPSPSSVLPALDSGAMLAPLADLSSADPALALAAARGLCERTGGAGVLDVRVLLMGSTSNYEAACMAEVAAGAQQHLLACLACHDKCVPVIEYVAHCVRNLCACGESRAEHRSALFPAFTPLAAAVVWLATSGGTGSECAADAVWLAMGNLMLNCNESECATGLLCVPDAVIALSACAARQGLECYNAAFFLVHLFDAAEGFELRESAHTASHVCLPPLLAISRSGSEQAVRAILSMLTLKDACACHVSPCALCDTIAPLCLPAVADALTRNSTSGRVCKLLVKLLRTLKWEDCTSRADVQLAVDALLACLGSNARLDNCTALAAVDKKFVSGAVSALGNLLMGTQQKHWHECLFEQAFAPLVALLKSSLCKHISAAGVLGHTLGDFVYFCTGVPSQLNRAASSAPAVIETLMTFKEDFYALSGAAYFIESMFRATRFWTVRTPWIFGAQELHWRGFSRLQSCLLPHMPVLLRALAKVNPATCSNVSKIITMASRKCFLQVACPHCKALQAACLPAAPMLVEALRAVATHSRDGIEWAWAGLDLATAVSDLAAHCSGSERSALVMSALEPLVEVISAFSPLASSTESSMHTVSNSALVLSLLVGMGACAATADAEAAKAELLAHHVPALRAASDCLQAPPPNLLRLLRLLGVHSRLLLVHMPPPEAALRLRSCLECWRAAPRRTCPDARAHGELLDCPICRAEEGDAAAAEASMVALHCGHLFHLRCLSGWVAAQRARKGSMCCPLDKAPITRQALTDEDAPGCTLVEEAAEGGSVGTTEWEED